MPAVKDFRVSLLSLSAIDNSGRHIGRNTYWKLYAIENIFRIIIHSVLSIQIPTGWWAVAVDDIIKQKATNFRNNYLKKPWHGQPGHHELYYTDLIHLAEIMRANSNLFTPVIPNIDKWILGIEDLRLPRNIVAHMNFPGTIDKQRIDVFYSDCGTLLRQVQNKLSLTIP